MALDPRTEGASFFPRLSGAVSKEFQDQRAPAVLIAQTRGQRLAVVPGTAGATPEVTRALRDFAATREDAFQARETAYALFLANPVFGDSGVNLQPQALANALFPETLLKGAALPLDGPGRAPRSTLNHPEWLGRVDSINLDGLARAIGLN